MGLTEMGDASVFVNSDATTKKLLLPNQCFIFYFKEEKCHVFLPPAQTPETWVAWASSVAFSAILAAFD